MQYLVVAALVFSFCINIYSILTVTVERSKMSQSVAHTCTHAGQRIEESTLHEPTSRNDTGRKQKLLAKYWRAEAEVNISHALNPRRDIKEQYEFRYAEYAESMIFMPNFVIDEHKHSFEYSRPSIHRWHELPELARHGTISVVKDGKYHIEDDCGYKSNYLLHQPLHSNETQQQKVVVLADVHAKHFQHFMDSGLLKLVQASVYLEKNPDALVLAHFSNKGNSMMAQILRKMGFEDTMFLPWESNSKLLHASELVLVCQAPPLHPALWQRAREMLGCGQRTRDREVVNVVYVTRNRQNSRNGRLVINDEDVRNYLLQRFQHDNVIIFDSHEKDLNETMSIFSKADVIVGLHGGGLYNMLFAPFKAHVVEIMPLRSNGDFCDGSSQIFWVMSNLLEMNYWRINTPLIGNDARIDLDHLQLVLNHIERDNVTNDRITDS